MATALAGEPARRGGETAADRRCRRLAVPQAGGAALGVLCGGRFTLGLGVGWSAEEFAALGVPFTGRSAIFANRHVSGG